MKGEINFDIDGLVQGNNKSILPITVTKKGSVENIEGATVRVAIKHGGSLFTKQAVITDAENGKCEVTLTREDLTGSGWHFYQPTITFPDDREYTGGIDRFNVSGKLSGPAPVPVPNGIDLSRLGINPSGRLTIDGVEQIGGSGGGGGTVPSNVILFEDWTGGETVTIDTGTSEPPDETPEPEPPADITAPTVSVSPNGGNFTTSQSVTLTANEPATIYYTLDGSTPSTSSSVYSAAINLTDTKTIRFFAKDTAGNQSAVQSVTFTKTVEAPSDTTAPVLTMTAAATFADTQTVTMSANETADIWYTVDGSDPKTSGTKVKYSAPVTLTATTTVKAYAVDTAGNASAVQTVTYTKQFVEGSGYLQLNGVSDFVSVPVLNSNVDTIELNVNIDGTDADGYLVDLRTGTFAYLVTGAMSGFTAIKENDVSKTPLDNTIYSNITKNSKIKLSLSRAAYNGQSMLFAKSDKTQGQKAKVYSVKFYGSGVLKAHYDFTNSGLGDTVSDISGNGNPAATFSGTRVN